MRTTDLFAQSYTLIFNIQNMEPALRAYFKIQALFPG